MKDDEVVEDSEGEVVDENSEISDETTSDDATTNPTETE